MMNTLYPDVSSLLRLIRTTRHLRADQVAYRLRRILIQRTPFRRHVAAAPSLNVLAPSPRDLATDLHSVTDEAEGLRIYEELQQDVLTLLNTPQPFNVKSPDWQLGPRTSNRLWSITLHYHEWLYELARFVGRQPPSSQRHTSGVQPGHLMNQVLGDWLKTCDLGEPGTEALAWNSYAIATRLGWWTRIWYTLGRTHWDLNPELAHDFLASYYAQARHLESNLEWDLRGNHLLKDAVGLAWAGRFFQGEIPRRWTKTATELALQQAEEQVLADGGHFERSPFYHLEVMNDWLTLSRLLPDVAAADRMLETWRRSAEYVRLLTHPDGTVPQFNDGAAAAAGPYLALGEDPAINLHPNPRDGLHWLQPSGVVAWRAPEWTLFWDVGDIGPDYQPGHSHADSLTLEASFRGRKLFVDPGTYSYDHDAIRVYDRATRSHNTVAVDGENSSEVWHIFRVGRRARVRDVHVERLPDGFAGTARHDGYRHLAGRPLHERNVSVTGADTLTINDRVIGNGSHQVEGGFLLAPDWEARDLDYGWMIRCNSNSLRVELQSDRPLTTSIEQRPIHPDYGEESMTQRLTWRHEGPLPISVQVRVRPWQEPLP